MVHQRTCFRQASWALEGPVHAGLHNRGSEAHNLGWSGHLSCRTRQQVGKRVSLKQPQQLKECPETGIVHQAWW